MNNFPEESSSSMMIILKYFTLLPLIFSPTFSQQFLSQVSKWISGRNSFEQENCFFLNFGATIELPLRQISVGKSINIEQILDSLYSNECFFVFIGEQYKKDLDFVVEIVQKVTKVLAKNPEIVFTSLGKISNGANEIFFEDKNFQYTPMVTLLSKRNIFNP